MSSMSSVKVLLARIRNNIHMAIEADPPPRDYLTDLGSIPNRI